MLTKYTAAEIMSRLMNLDMLHYALRGDIDLKMADAEKIIKEAQEALQTYHNFLLIRGYVDTDIVGGSDNADNH